MLKKYQVLELESGEFMVAESYSQISQGAHFLAKICSSSKIGTRHYAKAAEAQEKADELNEASSATNNPNR